MSNHASHSRLAGFDSYYKLKILPILSTRADLRKATLRKFWKFPAIAFPLGFVFDFFQDSDAFLFGFGSFIALIVSAVAGLVLYAQARDKLKGEVLPELCKFLGLDYILTSTGRIDPRRFRELGLLPSWDRINLEDEISGRYRDVGITLLEATLVEIIETTDEDGDTHEQRTVKFQGLLFECDFPKRFKGTTTVLRDRFFKGFRKGERVRLEDPEFEKLYDVFGDDQVEARYLLTPRFMERIKELDRVSNSDGLQLAFTGDKMLMALRMRGDQFEIGSMLKSMVGKHEIEAVAEQICIVFDVVETLSLDNAEY